MNKYQEVATRPDRPLGSPWRIRTYGAVLGAGIPILIAGVAYWLPGGGLLPVLGLWGAIVGLGAGAAYADLAITSDSPLHTGLHVAWKAALAGTLAIVIPYCAVFFVPAIAVGIVLGGMVSLPVALVSVLVLRFTARRQRVARTIAIALIGLSLAVGGSALLDVVHGSPGRTSVDGGGSAWIAP